MSVLDLNGVADAAERKRLLLQAEQEMKNAGAWKIIPPAILCVIVLVLLMESNWLSALWPKTASAAKIYEWILFMLVMVACMGVANYWRRSERKAVLVEILKSARRCTGCGYPIDESPGAVCPECGTVRGHL